MEEDLRLVFNFQILLVHRCVSFWRSFSHFCFTHFSSFLLLIFLQNFYFISYLTHHLCRISSTVRVSSQHAHNKHKNVLFYITLYNKSSYRYKKNSWLINSYYYNYILNKYKFAKQLEIGDYRYFTCERTNKLVLWRDHELVFHRSKG